MFFLWHWDRINSIGFGHNKNSKPSNNNIGFRRCNLRVGCRKNHAFRELFSFTPKHVDEIVNFHV